MYHQDGSFKHKVEMQPFSKFKEIVEQVQSHLNSQFVTHSSENSNRFREKGDHTDF